MRTMKKQYGINLLGGNVTDVAEMLGYSRQAIHQWTDPLTTRLEALVMYHYAKLPPSQKRKNKAKAEALLRGQASKRLNTTASRQTYAP